MKLTPEHFRSLKIHRYHYQMERKSWQDWVESQQNSVLPNLRNKDQNNKNIVAESTGSKREKIKEIKKKNKKYNIYKGEKIKLWKLN